MKLHIYKSLILTYTDTEAASLLEFCSPFIYTRQVAPPHPVSLPAWTSLLVEGKESLHSCPHPNPPRQLSLVSGLMAAFAAQGEGWFSAEPTKYNSDEHSHPASGQGVTRNLHPGFKCPPIACKKGVGTGGGARAPACCLSEPLQPVPHVL